MRLRSSMIMRDEKLHLCSFMLRWDEKLPAFIHPETRGRIFFFSFSSPLRLPHWSKRRALPRRNPSWESPFIPPCPRTDRSIRLEYSHHVGGGAGSRAVLEERGHDVPFVRQHMRHRGSQLLEGAFQDPGCHPRARLLQGPNLCRWCRSESRCGPIPINLALRLCLYCPCLRGVCGDSLVVPLFLNLNDYPTFTSVQLKQYIVYYSRPLAENIKWASNVSAFPAAKQQHRAIGFSCYGSISSCWRWTISFLD